MNNHGQVLFFSLMLGIVILVVALALAGPIKDSIDSARNATTDEGQVGLNCTSPVLSNYDKGACLVSDLSIFYFISGLIFIAGAIMVSKIIFQ